MMKGQTLSVIIGAYNARSSVVQCLESVERQRNDQVIEVIVVDNSSDGTADLAAQFDRVELIRSPESNFIPELWEVGINRSTGDIIAITTAHCIPAEDWIDHIFEAHETTFAGIGGAIENDDTSGPVEWAIYFCRYSRYMLPFEKSEVDDIAGDNASYKRPAMEMCKESRRDGFWEPTVHAELAKEGLRLLMTPSIVVRHKESFTAGSFTKNRFWHGRQFGAARASQLSVPRRLVYALLSPLIPFVLLSRIARLVLARKRHLTELLLSLPILTWFLISWSAGEFAGYLAGRDSRERTATV